jgi:Protein of unknown function (DUF2934)
VTNEIEKTSTKTRKPRKTKAHATHEQIAARAYEIYLERGGTGGNQHEDWVRAERELAEKRPKPTRRKATPKAEAA